jgi:hypothetical protein
VVVALELAYLAELERVVGGGVRSRVLGIQTPDLGFYLRERLASSSSQFVAYVCFCVQLVVCVCVWGGGSEYVR